MSDHTFQRPMGSLEVNVVEFFGSITIGSSGAVASTDLTKGITSITYSTTGKYTVLLDSAYNKLLWANVSMLHSTDSSPATVGTFFRVNSEAVGTTGAIVFQAFTGDDGADAEPASGAILYFNVKCRNSDVS